MLVDLLNIFMSGENLILTLIFYTVVIALYSVFVYFFYRFLAKKDIISLNLSQYNVYKNGAIMKFFAVIFYIIEYIILLPIVTFVWFAFLAILILVLSENMGTDYALLVSAALVAAVRVTAHIKEDLSKDLAKMLPFTLLTISITSGIAFFSASSLTSRIEEIPTLINSLPYYLLFIVGTELLMRVSSFLISSMRIVQRIKEEGEVIEETTETE